MKEINISVSKFEPTSSVIKFNVSDLEIINQQDLKLQKLQSNDCKIEVSASVAYQNRK
jgi:hypothetical protein